MKLTDWAHTAEIVSAVAVVLSLLYVGFGINQNTRAIRSGTHQALLDSSQELDYVKLANPHVLSAILHAESDSGTLSESEREIFAMYAQMTFSKWKNIFLNHESGLLQSNLWRAYAHSYEPLRQIQAYRDFWQERSDFYVPTFQSYIDSVIATERKIR